MIVFINSFNLIDGIDGLASGISIIAAGVLGVWFYLAGHIEYTILSFSLIGALSGFFWFNVYGKKNKIFMGRYRFPYSGNHHVGAGDSVQRTEHHTDPAICRCFGSGCFIWASLSTRCSIPFGYLPFESTSDAHHFHPTKITFIIGYWQWACHTNKPPSP